MQGIPWIHKRFGRSFLSVDTFFNWLGKETNFGGSSTIQAVRVAATAL
jgi:hypothetical protein